MERISLTSAIVDCHMTIHNWLQFQNEGHSITWRSADGRSRPYQERCPSCRAKAAVHPQEDLQQYHASDRIFCLNLFTPGTNPDDWKNTGIQCIRVQAPTEDEAVRLMQEAIINTVYAFGRQEFSIQFNQEQLNQLVMERSWLQMFMSANMNIPAGSTPLREAVKILRKHFQGEAPGSRLSSDANELLPQEWRRD